MANLEDQLKEVRYEENRILSAIDERNKKRIIQCGGCSNSHEIGNLEAIQTHWYTEPHGCTGGDYWNEGELQFVCPETGIINRLLFNNNDIPYEERKIYDNDAEQQFKRKYKKLFKKIVDNYDKEIYAKRVNNDYVDKSRGKFGLVEKRKILKTDKY